MLLIIVAALVLILSVVLAWLVGPLLGLAAIALLVLRILLVAVGAGTSGFILYLFFKERRLESAAKKL
ncbi:MAG TPA: hypothetical protein VGR64_06730, partial [Terracidiphilus sp.]|nr:hypothetical protein [Terracidiphilus sp.]